MPVRDECMANSAVTAAEKFGAGLVGKKEIPESVKACSIMREVVVLPLVARDENRRHVLCQRAQQMGTQLQCNAAGKIRAAPAQEPNGEPSQFAG